MMGGAKCPSAWMTIVTPLIIVGYTAVSGGTTTGPVAVVVVTGVEVKAEGVVVAVTVGGEELIAVETAAVDVFSVEMTAGCEVAAVATPALQPAETAIIAADNTNRTGNLDFIYSFPLGLITLQIYRMFEPCDVTNVTNPRPAQSNGSRMPLRDDRGE
jgi:hypothetical protein